MQRRIFLSILACSLIGVVASCDSGKAESFVAARSDRVKLIDTFESYASISDVQQFLKSRGLTWAVIEGNSTVTKDEKRPPFNFYVIKVNTFTDSQSEGSLRLEFFNNRLMATWFYPKNFSAYRRVIEGRYPQLRTNQSVVIGQYASIEFGMDHERRNYIAWEDTRLRDELGLWIKRYS